MKCAVISVSYVFFLFKRTPTPQFSPLSLHDALPISIIFQFKEYTVEHLKLIGNKVEKFVVNGCHMISSDNIEKLKPLPKLKWRSEEHTSELQSQFHLVCRLLLEIKKSTSCCRIRTAL